MRLSLAAESSWPKISIALKYVSQWAVLCSIASSERKDNVRACVTLSLYKEFWLQSIVERMLLIASKSVDEEDLTRVILCERE